jgi:hypothetical protein
MCKVCDKEVVPSSDNPSICLWGMKKTTKTFVKVHLVSVSDSNHAPSEWSQRRYPLSHVLGFNHETTDSNSNVWRWHSSRLRETDKNYTKTVQGLILYFISSSASLHDSLSFVTDDYKCHAAQYTLKEEVRWLRTFKSSA